jgi:ubiquinone/menaquinone biosynthesis C-methylase UbiE
MPDESGHGDAERRRALLEETGRTYAAYVESGYSERWSGREPGVAIAVAERNAWVAAALEPALGGTVVDLGCGDGALGMLLDTAARHPRRLIGFDLLESRVALARAQVPWAEFHQASADELALADGSANAVVAMTLFSSLTDDWFVRRVAAEIGRVMARGGRLVVYDIRYPSPRNNHVRPVRPTTLASLFPGWAMQVRAMTLLPPLARSRLAAGPRRYRVLEAIPLLRSHIGAVLIKP